MNARRPNSPFPGMDPFIESRGLWEDFHLCLIAQIAGAINPLLPDSYVARMVARGYVVVADSNG